MNRKIAVVLFLLVGVAIAGYYVGMTETNQKRDPITIMSNVISVKMDLNDLIAKADVIAIGQVNAMGQSQWNTVDGKLPPGTTIKNISRELTIFTDTEFHIDQIIKGTVKQPVILIRTFGGQVNQDRLIVADEPSLETKQTYLLFLIQDRGRTASIKAGHYLVLSTIQYIYKIVDGKAISTSDEWASEDLISYIQHTLSTPAPTPKATASAQAIETLVPPTPLAQGLPTRAINRPQVSTTRWR